MHVLYKLHALDDHTPADTERMSIKCITVGNRDTEHKTDRGLCLHMAHVEDSPMICLFLEVLLC